MATTTWNSSQQIFNDADFQALVTNIHNALSAMGLVQTADTGQINPATVTKPTAINTAGGYEIWRFNDALQATKPVFIKIEYGTANPATCPSLWITVGTATDGAGTITTQAGTRTQCSAGSSSGTVTGSYVSGSSSRITAGIMVNTSNTANLCFNIERSKDSTGADNGEAIVVTLFSPNNGAWFQWVPFTGSIPAGQSNLPVLMPPSGTTTAVEGANVGMFPVQPNPVGPLKPPTRGWLIYFNGDISALVDQSVPIYGANHTYKPLGIAGTGLSKSSFSGNVSALAMLYE